MLHLRTAAAALALVLVSGCSGPMGLSNFSQETSSLSAADRNFVSQAAYGSLAEIQLGKLAQEKASNAAVREFGRTMVTEHTQMNEDLIKATSDKGVTPPTSTDDGREAVADAMEQLSGAEFDRQYIAEQLADHQTTLTLFENQAERGQDVQLRQFAQRYTPVVKRHVDSLRRMSAPMVSSK
jgi:putative membrane protein